MVAMAMSGRWWAVVGVGRWGAVAALLAATAALAFGGPTGAVAEPATQVEAATVGWTAIGGAAAGPGARWDHTLSADEAGGRLVLFGGRDAAAAPLGDTWLFDLEAETWEATDATGPSPRFGHAVAVDAEAGVLYLFGGQADGDTFFDDAWRLDLESLAWSELAAGVAAGPSARYGTSAVLDGRGNLLVSHGFTFEGRFDDTWALDLEAETWTDLSPAPETRPLKRCLHEAVWDGESERMLLFGGCSSGFGPCPQGDLWAFDPAARTWTLLAAADVGPGARSNPALVVEPGGEGALLFGGLTEAGYAADLWTLPLGDAAATWTQSGAAGAAPSPRASHDAVVSGDCVFLYGGIGDDGALGDLWVLPLGGQG